MRPLARWVSIIGHPFVTALSLLALLEHGRGMAAAARTTGLAAALVVAPLAALMAHRVRHGRWSTVDASDPRERPVLFLVAAAGVAAFASALVLGGGWSPLARGIVGTLALLALSAALTPWLKVSLHLAIAALATTVLAGRGAPAAWAFGAALPMLAWSRVALGRHSWPEVAAGTALGAVAGATLLRVV